MHIWTIEKWTKYYTNQEVRNGVRLKFDKDVDSDVRRASKDFLKWIRTEYFFPIRVPIYVKSSKQIRAMDGEMVIGTFFRPFDKLIEPYIRIATGDFDELVEKRGTDDALWEILRCISHELTHYFQWINDLQLTEIGEERQADMYSRFVLDEYYETRKHP